MESRTSKEDKSGHTTTSADYDKMEKREQRYNNLAGICSDYVGRPLYGLAMYVRDFKIGLPQIIGGIGLSYILNENLPSHPYILESFVYLLENPSSLLKNPLTAFFGSVGFQIGKDIDKKIVTPSLEEMFPKDSEKN